MIEFEASIDRSPFQLACAFSASAEALALFGPSGAGKSTVLGVLAGLIRPDSGRVVLDGETLIDTARGIFVPPHLRRIGVVFQDSLLFPHLSVRGNLAYGQPRSRRVTGVSAAPGAPFGASFDEVVELLGIAALLDRRPVGLSGGERQRVAIGRALLSQPRLLLLDEPMAALDFDRRREIMPYIVRLRDEARVPMVYVSHAIDEVARIAQQVVVLQAGKAIACGAPGDVLAPAGLRGAQGGFGAVSVLEARVRAHDPLYGLTLLEHPAGPISVPGEVGQPGQLHRLLIRATDVALAVQRPRDVSFRTVLRGILRDIESDAGPIARVDIALLGHGRLVALVTRKALDDLGLDVGDEVYAMVKATAMDDRSLAYAPRVR